MKLRITKRQKTALFIAVPLLVLVSGVLIILLVANNKDETDTSPASESSSSGSQLRVTTGSEPTYADTLASLKKNEKYTNPRTDINYAELFRNADQYTGQYVRYTGEVVQVLGEPGGWNLRVNITKKDLGSGYALWQDTIFIYSYSRDRAIDQDIISFTGLVNGTTTYKSVLGGDITLPALTIYEHELVGRKD